MKYAVHRVVQPSYISKAYAIVAAMNDLPAGSRVIGYEVDTAAGSNDRLIDIIYEVAADA